jgi:hypothetical protein
VDEKLDGSVWDYFKGFAQDAAKTSSGGSTGVIEGVDPMIFGTAVSGMVLQLVHNYLVEKKFRREDIVATS